MLFYRGAFPKHIKVWHMVATVPISGSARSPEGGHGNPLQYSYLENPMDLGASRATVHMVAKSQT